MTFLQTCVAQALRRGVVPRHSLPRFGTTASVMKGVQRRFDLIKKKNLCVVIATAEIPRLRRLLLTNCFTAASMTKMQFKQNTSEKLDYRYCCIWHPTHLNERLSRFKLEDGQHRKNMMAISASSARRKVGSFQNQERFHFFCNCQGGGG